MCMPEKVLVSFTLDYCVGLFNMELDPGVSGGVPYRIKEKVDV